MLVHIPRGGENGDTDAFAVRHDEMPERHDHRFVPHFQIGVEITATLTGMRGAAGGEYRFAILFGHGGERQHFEAVHRHGGNLHPVGERLRRHAFGHAVGAVWEVALELKGEDMLRQRVKRLIGRLAAAVLCDEVEHLPFDGFLRLVDVRGFLRLPHAHAMSFPSYGCRIIRMLSIIPLSPFFAGVTLVTSRLARGKENVDVFKTFIEGIKNNWKRFLIHGVITYFAVIFSYFSIRLYSALISQPNADSFFLVMLYVCLIISIIIAVAFLFIFFYVPSMTVTFDLSLKNIYKNSALMSFGELKHNIIATFGLFVIVLFCATILIFVGNTDSSIALIITTAILMFVLVPALASYVINASVYPGMYNLMTEKEKRSKKIDKKMDNRRKGQFIDEEDEENNIAEEFLDLDVEENKDGDEYIFYNGKMVKRSVIIKMKKEREKAEGKSDESKTR